MVYIHLNVDQLYLAYLCVWVSLITVIENCEENENNENIMHANSIKTYMLK